MHRWLLFCCSRWSFAELLYFDEIASSSRSSSSNCLVLRLLSLSSLSHHPLYYFIWVYSQSLSFAWGWVSIFIKCVLELQIPFLWALSRPWRCLLLFGSPHLLYFFQFIPRLHRAPIIACGWERHYWGLARHRKRSDARRHRTDRRTSMHVD